MPRRLTADVWLAFLDDVVAGVYRVEPSPWPATARGCSLVVAEKSRRADVAALGVPGVSLVHNDIAIVIPALDRP